MVECDEKRFGMHYTSQCNLHEHCACKPEQQLLPWWVIGGTFAEHAHLFQEFHRARVVLGVLANICGLDRPRICLVCNRGRLGNPTSPMCRINAKHHTAMRLCLAAHALTSSGSLCKRATVARKR
jgi:hypothetical protein